MYTYEITYTYNNHYIAVILKDGREIARNLGDNKAALTRWAKANIAAYKSGYLPSPK